MIQWGGGTLRGNDCKDKPFGFKKTGYFLLIWVNVIAQGRPEP
jgi:hypothetical protein